MSTDWQGPKTSRRDFLGLLGGALGGVALTRGSAFALIRLGRETWLEEELLA